MPKKPTPDLDFEAALASGTLSWTSASSFEQSLEETLASFQKGIELTRSCQEGLKAAEQKVEQLIQKNGKYLAEPVEPEDE